MNRTKILKTSLDVLFYSGASHGLRNALGGRGAILMLHHICPGGGLQSGFAPNAGLEITPEFLEAAIARVTELGYELLSLGEAVARLSRDGEQERPFAVFTIDDGYRDNLEFALPVFRRHRCPFTIFVTSSIIDGTCEIWWRGLEAVVAGATRLKIDLAGQKYDLPAASVLEKQKAFDRLYWPMRAMPELEQRKSIRRIAGEHGVDLAALCRSYAMSWDDVRVMASEPLCTIGAHTVNHFAIAKLSAEEATREAAASRERIEAEIGGPVWFFAYPYGDAASAGPRDFALIRDAGFKAAVTTRKGLIYGRHRDYLTALPRVALNGSFQKIRYLDVLLSGTALTMWNAFRPVSVT
jgi:peptidoglycan/xylan/chitin deacetylase (PgdA/CDA1 family)